MIRSDLKPEFGNKAPLSSSSSSLLVLLLLLLLLVLTKRGLSRLMENPEKSELEVLEKALTLLDLRGGAAAALFEDSDDDGAAFLEVGFPLRKEDSNVDDTTIEIYGFFPLAEINVRMGRVDRKNGELKQKQRFTFFIFKNESLKKTRKKKKKRQFF